MLNRKLRNLLILSVDDYETSYRYFKYLILELGKCFDQIILIGNHTIDYEWRNNHISVFFSEQIYDVEKWREFILENWNEIERIDELYLMNSSMFGPIYDLNPMIQKMRKHKCDFWGITKHNSIFIDKEKITDTFLQRYFLCLKKSVLNTELLQYFKGLPPIKSYEEADKFFEFQFTENLVSKGFTYGCFCDTSDLDAIDRKYSVSHILVNLDKLIKNKKMPFVPKILFQIDRKNELEYREGLQNIKVINYLKKYTAYDTNMILEYLIKNNNVYDNLINLNLYFEFDAIRLNDKSIKRNSNEILVVAYLFYIEELEERLKYLKNIESIANILIITDSRKKARIIKKKGRFEKKIIICEQRGRDWGALLVAARSYVVNYKYVCFVHDKRSDYLAYTSLGSSFQDLLWENMLGSKEYVENLIACMDESDKIGLMLPPIFNMGIYNSLYGNYWSVCFDATVALAKKIKINSHMICSKKPPISIGSCFWCKVDALKPLWQYNFTYDDFLREPMPIDGTINHALERIIPYIAQEQGFLTGITMTKEYSQLYHANSEYMIQTILRKLGKEGKYLGTFQQMLELI